MKFDQAINKILQENYFGGSPYERATGERTHTRVSEDEQGEFISGSEAKAIQKALGDTISARRGGKKRSNLQMVDPNQLSPAGREFIAKLDHAADMYKQGSAIGGNAELRTQAVDLEDQAFADGFSQTRLDYVGFDRGSGFKGAHLYRYPNTAGDDHRGIPFDKDGFRIEAMMEQSADDEPMNDIELFPMDQFDVVNLFAKGSDEPILTRGKITQ